jgi:5-oxoprolinase (ATP-hydrolysing) subunit A
MSSKKTGSTKIKESSKASPPAGEGGLEGAESVDLNCDLGEGSGNDLLIMPFISSANIACGYHAGNENTIWETIELALKHKVAIGAHVSFLDKENFGRTEMNLPAEEIYDLITQQLIIMNEILSSFDIKMNHVKPHGALYNMSAKDTTIANTIAKAVKDFDDTLILFGLSGSCSINEAKAIGLKTASEVFADRTYQDNGSLTPRSHSQALIEEEEKSLQQVLQMIQKGTVTCLSGKTIPIAAETICIHGDGKKAAAFAKRIYENLKQNNIAIKAI